jgi:hypothetical protein
MIRILDPETGVCVDVAVSPHVVQAFRKQIELDDASYLSETFRDRMRHWLTDAIVHGLSYDLKPPTEKQVVFAAAIARKLGVDLPKEALQFRDAISGFIDTHKDEYFRLTGRTPT